MGKPMYITLDTLMFSDNEEEDTRLVKRVDEDYKGKTFGELLDKMKDGSVDEYNDQEYNAHEMQLANHVNDLLVKANSNPADVILYAFSKDEPPEEIAVGLNEKMSQYTDRIVKIETVPGESGEEKKYQKIELSIADNTAGGILMYLK